MRIEALGFTTYYDAEVVAGVTGARSVHRFDWKRAQPEPGALVWDTPSGSMLVKVVPYEGDPWIGEFAEGLGGVSGLFATPSPTTLCVVSRGQGYWVPVLAPSDFKEVRCCPIKSVFVVPERNIVVFASYTELSCYGPDGFLWMTDRLSWDGLKITDITPQEIRGLAWDSPENKEVEFVVDIETGKHQGGASP